MQGLTSLAEQPLSLGLPFCHFQLNKHRNSTPTRKVAPQASVLKSKDTDWLLSEEKPRQKDEHQWDQDHRDIAFCCCSVGMITGSFVPGG